jgi:hypothetical protein
MFEALVAPDGGAVLGEGEVMRPGETTALPQLTTVASAGSQPQPTQAMMPSAPMSTEPPR